MHTTRALISTYIKVGDPLGSRFSMILELFTKNWKPVPESSLTAPRISVPIGKVALDKVLV